MTDKSSPPSATYSEVAVPRDLLYRIWGFLAQDCSPCVQEDCQIAGKNTDVDALVREVDSLLKTPRSETPCIAVDPAPSALPREEFLRLSVEDAMDVLERYPNLRAILQGCVSGHSSEWPMLRTELQILLYSIHAHTEEMKKTIPSASVRISMKDARLIQSVLESVHSELRPGNATIWADNVRDSRKALDEAIHG